MHRHHRPLPDPGARDWEYIYISPGAVLHGLPAGPDIPRHPAMAGRTGDGDPPPYAGDGQAGAPCLT